MTLTKTFIPYNRQPKYDAKIDALYWERVPLPDPMQQEFPLSDLVFTVRDFLDRRHDPAETFVSSDTSLCYDPDNLNVRLMPDLYVAFGVDEAAIRARDAGYIISEVGKQPDFVLEMASKTTAHNDLNRKRDIYARIGIPEYWRFDATGGDFYGVPLAGEELVEGEYRPLEITDYDGHPKGYSPILDLVLSWHNGDFRIYDRELQEYSQTTYEKLMFLNDQNTILEEQTAIIEQQRTSLNSEVMARRAAEERIQRLEEELRQIRGSRNGESN